jgi:flagellar biogenesis protein FliO
MKPSNDCGARSVGYFTACFHASMETHHLMLVHPPASDLAPTVANFYKLAARYQPPRRLANSSNYFSRFRQGAAFGTAAGVTMTWTIRISALALLAVVMADRLAAQDAGPPPWNDNASVYLAMSQNAAAEQSADTETAKANQAVEPADPRPQAQQVETQAAKEPVRRTVAPAQSDGRRLPPPSARYEAQQSGTTDNTSASTGAARRLAEYGVPAQSMYTILCALAIVIGAFLLFAWALKRGARMAARRGQLPTEVVSVLGRIPLAAKQFAELLRVGNKLVLISLTPTGAETITEVTDPAEVDRLVGLCQQNSPFSTTQAFEQVFQQMSAEAAPVGFLGNDAAYASLASPTGSYRANRGGSRV